MSGRAVIVTLLATLSTAGCGSSTGAGPRSSVAPAEMRVLSSTAVPGLPSVTHVLTVGDLAKDAPIPGLASKIQTWGYLDGRERTFQGQSRHLTFVLSRSLIFDDAAGARSFISFVRSNAQAYFGVSTGTHPLVAQGRLGWVFSPPACACHLANPVMIAVLDSGPLVVWLEINGPDATRPILVNLLEPARSTAVALAS